MADLPFSIAIEGKAATDRKDAASSNTSDRRQGADQGQGRKGQEALKGTLLVRGCFTRHYLMATSFPYLAIARQIGTRYGDVLCFADSLEKQPDDFTASEWEARRRLDAASQLAITRVWADENARRRRVMKGIDEANGSGGRCGV
jgi:hypothetical protein